MSTKTRRTFARFCFTRRSFLGSPPSCYEQRRRRLTAHCGAQQRLRAPMQPACKQRRSPSFPSIGDMLTGDSALERVVVPAKGSPKLLPAGIHVIRAPDRSF
jgi:hypothetical protein